MIAELEGAIGRQCRALRIDRALTQAELADRANVSLGALRHLEAGNGATTTTLVKVVRVLGREEWLEALAPTRPFSPIALLEQQRAQKTATARPRVRRRPKP